MTAASLGAPCAVSMPRRVHSVSSFLAAHTCQCLPRHPPTQRLRHILWNRAAACCRSCRRRSCCQSQSSNCTLLGLNTGSASCSASQHRAAVYMRQKRRQSLMRTLCHRKEAAARWAQACLLVSFSAWQKSSQAENDACSNKPRRQQQTYSNLTAS